MWRSDFCMRQCYQLYFGCKIEVQGKKWMLHICRNTCERNLSQCLTRKKIYASSKPIIWREQTDHRTDYYFCMVTAIAKGLPKKRNGHCNIQIFHQIFVQPLVMKTYQSYKNRNRMKLCQMIRSTMKPQLHIRNIIVQHTSLNSINQRVLKDLNIYNFSE